MWSKVFDGNVTCPKLRNRLYGGRNYGMRLVDGSDGEQRCRVFCETHFPLSTFWDYWPNDLDCDPRPAEATEACPRGWCNCYLNCEGGYL